MPPTQSYLEEVFVHNLQAAAAAHTLAWRADGARGHGLGRGRRGKRGRGGAGVLIPGSLGVHLQEQQSTGRRPLLPSTSHLPTGGHPKGCRLSPSASWGTQTYKPLEPRSPAFCPAQGAGGSPVGRRPTHQSFFPGAFAGPPGRQGCRPPTLLRHEPRALRAARAGKTGRHGSGAGGVHATPRSLGPAELLKAPRTRAARAATGT